MHLYANGCSHTYGQALRDCEVTATTAEPPSQLAWPAVLARLLRATLTNDSVPSASNDRIARTTLDYYQNHPPADFCVIMFSTIIRWETFATGESAPIPGRPAGPRTIAIWQTENDKTLRDFYATHWDIVDGYVNTLKNILLLEHFFESRGCPYLFCHFIHPAQQIDGYVQDSELVTDRSMRNHAAPFEKLLLNRHVFPENFRDHKVDEARDGIHYGEQTNSQYAHKLYQWMDHHGYLG